MHAVTTRHGSICSLQRLKRQSLSVCHGYSREERLVDTLSIEQGREYNLVFELGSTCCEALRNLSQLVPVLIYYIFPGEGEHATVLVVLDLHGTRQQVSGLVLFCFVDVNIVDVAREGCERGWIEGRQACGLRNLLPLGFVATVQVKHLILECASKQGGEVASSQRFLQACLRRVPAADAIAEDSCGFCYAGVRTSVT